MCFWTCLFSFCQQLLNSVGKLLCISRVIDLIQKGGNDIIIIIFFLAVDMWSAGVILLCLLSGRYPFFRCYDDMTALAQIVTLFGKRRVMDNAKHIGKFSTVCFTLRKANTAAWNVYLSYWLRVNEKWS